MDGLKEEQIEFLYLLAYLYMQQTKFDLALQLFRILRLHTAKNMKIALALSSCLHKAKRFEEALKVLSSIDHEALPHVQKVAYFYINSKILWDLKQQDESRKMLHHYLKLRQVRE